MWGHDDEAIFLRVMTEMEKLGIANRKEVLEYFTVRIPGVYPVYFLNYQNHLKVLLTHLVRISNLVSVGRQGLYQHDNMPTAIQSGLDVGRLIINHGSDDVGRINRIVYDDRIHKYDDLP